MFQTTNQVINCLPYEPQLISIDRPFAILYPLFLGKTRSGLWIPLRIQHMHQLCQKIGHAVVLTAFLVGAPARFRTQGDGCHSMAGGQGNHLKRLDKAIQFG